mgnify:CR=1 FL=1
MRNNEKLLIFVVGSMRVKKKIYQYVMLLVSIVMLMSVVVPHHIPHSNGLHAINHCQRGCSWWAWES